MIKVENHETDNGIIRILTLNRPETLNSISKGLLESLNEEILDIKKEKCIRVLILTGTGRSFSTGADLKERSSMSEVDVSTFLSQLMDCFTSISELPIPTIAAINGYCLGGGLELALCCDLRFATADFEKEQYMGLPEASLGIIPGAGGTQRLSRLLGPSKSKELIFTASKISANQALSLGLVNTIVKSEDLQRVVLELALNISKNAPLALRAAKESIDNGFHLELKEALKLERLCYQKTIQTKDRIEALQAFREKRKPKFTGE